VKVWRREVWNGSSRRGNSAAKGWRCSRIALVSVLGRSKRRGESARVTRSESGSSLWKSELSAHGVVMEVPRGRSDNEIRGWSWRSVIAPPPGARVSRGELVWRLAPGAMSEPVVLKGRGCSKYC
jgi:hypothetical protein